MQSEETVLSAPPPVNGGTGHAGDGTQYSPLAGQMPVELFDAHQLEQLTFRRFNPLSLLTAANLSAALDGYDAGVLMQAARLWERICERDDTIRTVKAKREESVWLRPWDVKMKANVPESQKALAEDQVAVLREFYQNLTATHALKRHVVGGPEKLVEQMMESVAHGYAAHHIIWEPDANRTVELPSGPVVPGLGAKLEYVPMEFFESRTGELRFLGLSLGYTGETLAPNNWMVTTGPALMQAASVLYYFKRLAKHDMVNFSERFGQPATLGQTTAPQGSPEGEAMKNAVKNLASNFRGVLYGAPENKIEQIWPSGGTSSTQLPPNVLEEGCKRDLIVLWLGEDLGTLSGKKDHSTGASLQGDDKEKRERGDVTRINGTINKVLDPIVIRYYFGPSAPVYARFEVEPPINEDRALLANVTQALVNMGARIPVRAVAGRLQVPIADDGDPDVFISPTAGFAITESTAANAKASHLQNIREPVLSALLGAARKVWPEAIAADLAPLRTALSRVLEGTDGGLLVNADALYRQIPRLGAKIIEAGRSEEALYQVLSAALATGISTTTHQSA